MTVGHTNYLDHPQVELIRATAADEYVIQAMLVSTLGDESLQAEYDSITSMKGRIRFLMRNRHGSPFEHNSMTFFVRAPIVVFREFHRHRIGWSYNEESGRYKQLDPTFYLPPAHRRFIQVGKAGSYTMEAGTPEQHARAVELMVEAYDHAYDHYEQLLDLGVAKELARFVLPVGIHSSMYATCNARSLMNFLSLRVDDPGAMFPSKPLQEIEWVARELELAFATYMPITYAAFLAAGRVAP